MRQYNAKVLKVYDGDTITVEIDVGFFMRTVQKIRLLGINAPEMRGDNKEEGKRSRDRLRELILGKDIIVHTRKQGKYGRYLGVIYVEIMEVQTNVNDLLLEEGLAILYDL